MKKVYLFFSAIALSMSVWAEPFFVRVNGTTDYPATAMSETDLAGRSQYKAACITLQENDVLTCYNEGAAAAWSIAAIDPYGGIQPFYRLRLRVDLQHRRHIQHLHQDKIQ